ncbi:MAG: methyltransferase [Rhizomicrobium sp.]
MRSISKLLSSPWMDRLVAFVAIIPFAYSVRHELHEFGFNPAWIAANGNFVLLIVTMLFRRSPTRITTSPVFWCLAFVATYWLFIMGRLIAPGPAVAPAWFVDSLSIASGAVCIWARVNLGRNIGLVPAQRELVSEGAYRFVRHPIYTGIYMSYVALALQSFTAMNAMIFAAGIALFVIKSFVEEGFLSHDPQYVAYMARVRWRWLPYVA